jgi:hypothetical protein
MRRIHASSRRNLDWKSIDWNKAERKVKELQMRIANDRVTSTEVGLRRA